MMLPPQGGGSIENVCGAATAKWEDDWTRFRVLWAVVLHASQRLGGAGECRPRDLLMGWIERGRPCDWGIGEGVEWVEVIRMYC